MTSQYDIFTREMWQKLPANGEIPLTKKDLEDIRSINDHLSMADVKEIYAPLIQLLAIDIRHQRSIQEERITFLREQISTGPFLIGITGSVAVGKSTTARLLKRLLTWYYPTYKVDLITTDGFLYSTKELTKRNLMNRKGFPESYRTEELIEALTNIKSGIRNIKIPLYSHESYDILEDEFKLIDQPDILIVEGINVLQNQINQQVYLNDFFDFSIYIDAEIKNIKNWYLERFISLLEVAKNKPDNYYFKFANDDLNKALQVAENAWNEINQPNLEQFILPSKYHANLILHKGPTHIIDTLSLRRY